MQISILLILWSWPESCINVYQQSDNFLYKKNQFQSQCIITVSLTSPLERVIAPSFKQNCICFVPRNVLCKVWLKLFLWFWRRRWRCENFSTFPTTTKTDCGQILIRNLKLKFSFRVTWANTYIRHMRFCLHTCIQSVIFWAKYIMF